jgi:hypothetical protein
MDNKDDKLSMIENLFNSQSAILTSSSKIKTIISNTAGILADDNNKIANLQKHGGLQKGQLPNLPRDFEGGYQRLFRDYFADSPFYTDYLFRQRFWMQQATFPQDCAQC